MSVVLDLGKVVGPEGPQGIPGPQGPAGPGADIEFDDTMTETNGVYSVTRPVHPVLTQAKYDALPEDKRNKGMYVISDGESSGSIDSLPGEVYSTEETVVGTFLGKLLYRRVWTGTIPNNINSTSSVELASASIPVDDMCRCDGYVKSKYNQWCAAPFYISNTDMCWIGYNPTTSAVSDSIRILGSSNQIGRRIVVILEYTKTTD